jgi:hypothetical protein
VFGELHPLSLVLRFNPLTKFASWVRRVSSCYSCLKCIARVVSLCGRRTSLACRRHGHSSPSVDTVRRRSSSSACAGIPRRLHLCGGCRRTREATSSPAQRYRRWHAVSVARAARTTTCSAGRAPCGCTPRRACRHSSTPSGSPRWDLTLTNPGRMTLTPTPTPTVTVTVIITL